MGQFTRRERGKSRDVTINETLRERVDHSLQAQFRQPPGKGAHLLLRKQNLV